LNILVNLIVLLQIDLALLLKNGQNIHGLHRLFDDSTATHLGGLGDLADDSLRVVEHVNENNLLHDHFFAFVHLGLVDHYLDGERLLAHKLRELRLIELLLHFIRNNGEAQVL